jgi:DNA-binding response OmpR family regulator
MPHLIFMDLGIPGIDSRETVRRVRRQHLTDAHVAILSANAFDKALENDAGVAAEDFIFRPPKVQDVLARIGRKLGLQWVTANMPVAAPAPIAPPPLLAPGADHLAALDEVIQFGSLRGILNKLTEIERLDAQHTPIIRRIQR